MAPSSSPGPSRQGLLGPCRHQPEWGRAWRRQRSKRICQAVILGQELAVAAVIAARQRSAMAAEQRQRAGSPCPNGLIVVDRQEKQPVLVTPQR